MFLSNPCSSLALSYDLVKQRTRLKGYQGYKPKRGCGTISQASTWRILDELQLHSQHLASNCVQPGPPRGFAKNGRPEKKNKTINAFAFMNASLFFWRNLAFVSNKFTKKSLVWPPTNSLPWNSNINIYWIPKRVPWPLFPRASGSHKFSQSSSLAENCQCGSKVLQN